MFIFKLIRRQGIIKLLSPYFYYNMISIFQNSAVSNIQKFPKDKYNLIPKIKIEVFNAEIEIKFVIIPQIPQLPRILNYNAKQLGIFSKFITEEIDKYMDEGFNESTDRKIEKLTEEALQRAGTQNAKFYFL